MDFTTPANSTLSSPTNIPVAAFNPACNGGNCIPQPGTRQKLDSLADRLMYRLSYRNFGGYESLVVNHSVSVGKGKSGRSGVRWYELRSPGGTPAVYQQGTFSPDSTYRWMGSIAQDKLGNIAVGYSASSSSVAPSIRYTGRLVSDALGTLQTETVLKAGAGSQLTGLARWGDYSTMDVDPVDGCTFWYTTEYYTAASQAASTVGWLTYIGAFKFPSCTPPAQGTLQGTVTDANSSLPINGALVQISNGFSITSAADGSYIRSLAPGTYTATASKFGYKPASATVTVNDGVATLQNFALVPIPVMAADSSSLVSEN